MRSAALLAAAWAVNKPLVVTVENHDTDHLEIVGGPFGDNGQIARGYAYILTHPGTPTVFWSDWSDRGDDVRKKIERCVQVRFERGLFWGSRCSIACAEWGLYAAYVDGMDHDAGRTLLDGLLAHAAEDRFIYIHNWAAFDLVMWDNRCINHRGRPWQSQKHRRVMRRTTIGGDGFDEAAALVIG